MTHQERIERVARALCRAIGVPEDGLVQDRPGGNILPAWQHQLPKAEAAYLETLRTIRDVGVPVIVPGMPPQWTDGSDLIGQYWRAHIDALIREAENDRS